MAWNREDTNNKKEKEQLMKPIQKDISLPNPTFFNDIGILSLRCRDTAIHDATREERIHLTLTWENGIHDWSVGHYQPSFMLTGKSYTRHHPISPETTGIT